MNSIRNELTLRWVEVAEERRRVSVGRNDGNVDVLDLWVAQVEVRAEPGLVEADLGSGIHNLKRKKWLFYQPKKLQAWLIQAIVESDFVLFCKFNSVTF